MKEKVVLAYSGGLDTSVILKWLCEKGFDVIAYVANVGQKDDFVAIKEKALKTGASKVYVEDLRREFVTDYIFTALLGNAMYEGRYLLGTAIARPLIAKRQVEIAEKEGAQYVAHGATGKGNDQVRFELTYAALNPNLKVISPWKDPEFLAKFKGRTDLINYAMEKGIPIKVSKKRPYSEDENLMHISHEAGKLEDPAHIPDEDVFTWTVSPKDAPDEETLLEIHFENGIPVKVVNLKDGTEKTDPLELFEYLNEVGAKNGVGRLDMVENRFIGIKSRGVYETPGATILWIAHRDLEGITMDKEVMHLRDMLAPKFAELIYNGFWFSPEMEFLLAAFRKAQENVTGKVTVSIYKGNVMPVARYSPYSLYNPELSSMDVEGGFDATDSKGFINIHALRLKVHQLVKKGYQR
ncbi:argininosuccinate synthase [Thermotoga maritima MSB8]|uniref:Argininosuccinate synthase n=2 Tax=Thermotoga maritima TaxID=2336 RepID=ASSY_THEMA|nr:argininosuccinate synthase [Thermotoga maritima]Q9X2A1.1 RecName: Full=Argininosuccinate synthase; AltName: Full=Citrulline--aspartate ligase [Thermotoga maritima MSB8]AAD36844.1 argininosuccinate synthase [Thermotoga maritima MSB8]AGL50713.1 Argininosuccinate synthase [Thermotoga maritima MSB8]AHD18327.1 argininosuccinate synthase [Thermotoga maritima MSB8]AKE27661.1 argininosuccinate synthase [Thermotoga maritima]AKE29534.1 argininosuccinate synthase [Thermotoga maritima MSB8]